MFPWWVGLVLAVISFVVLHIVSGLEPPKPDGIKNISQIMTKQMLTIFAQFGKYIVPALCCFGSLVSFSKKVQREKLYTKVKSQSKKSALFDMSWQQFETLVEEFFTRRGYSVKRTGGNGPDGGVDLILNKGADRYFVQCKQWKANKVGVQVVRELYGVMSAQGAVGGFVITAGEFSAEANRFVDGLNIRLFDGSHLHKMIREVEKPTKSRIADYHPPAATITTPTCQSCGKPMVKRVAKKGPNFGNEFWGCSGFPKCRSIVQI